MICMIVCVDQLYDQLYTIVDVYIYMYMNYMVINIISMYVYDCRCL